MKAFPVSADAIRFRESFPVEAKGPFDQGSAMHSLRVHAVEGLELHLPEERKHLRLIEVEGDFHPVLVSLSPLGVRSATTTADQGVLEAITSRVGFWFDLDADIDLVDAHLSRFPEFELQVGKRPGVRVTRFLSGFEGAAMTVLGQQVSLAACRLMGAKLVGLLGVSHSSGLRAFPTPESVAAQDPENLRSVLKTTGARTRTLQAVAGLFAEGFRLGPEPGAFREELIRLPGIGPWTVDYLSVRATVDPDRIPVTDAVIRRAMGGIEAKDLESLTKPWNPWRSYAAMRLWASQSGM